MPNVFHAPRSIPKCRILVCPEEVGGYSAHALRLPGVVGEGETIEEAIEDIRAALQFALRSYFEDDGSIPWTDNEIERPAGSVERWILVDL